MQCQSRISFQESGFNFITLKKFYGRQDYKNAHTGSRTIATAVPDVL